MSYPCAADTSDGIKQMCKEHGANAACRKFVMPLTSSLKRKAGVRHMLSPQFFAAMEASRVPATLHSILNMELWVPQHLQGGGRIGAASSSSHHPACFVCTLPFPSLSGIKQRVSDPEERKKTHTSFPSSAFPTLGNTAPWSVVIYQTVLKDTLK